MINVADYWIDILTDEGALGDNYPKDYHPPAGYGKLYMWDRLWTHCPSALNAWKDDQAPASLILLVPALASGTQIGGGLWIEQLPQSGGLPEESNDWQGRENLKAIWVLCVLWHLPRESGYIIQPHSEAYRLGVSM